MLWVKEDLSFETINNTNYAHFRTFNSQQFFQYLDSNIQPNDPPLCISVILRQSKVSDVINENRTECKYGQWWKFALFDKL